VRVRHGGLHVGVKGPFQGLYVYTYVYYAYVCIYVCMHVYIYIYTLQTLHKLYDPTNGSFDIYKVFFMISALDTII